MIWMAAILISMAKLPEIQALLNKKIKADFRPFGGGRAGPCWPVLDGEKNCDAAFGVAITEVTVVT